MREYFVYIMASHSKIIYIGVTNNLERRVYEHKNELTEGFTKKYKCKKLVFLWWFKYVNDVLNAEKKIKNWKRQWKMNLIEMENPEWKDLSSDCGIDFLDPEINSGGQRK